ncbi:polysaccharide pyruvyl transferase family protein [Vibrio cortegadensis]|uniref:polysaccharide pyruvyl transferase family protein n=1 Tax=Vibrio cortegadensis TaxID=1328770 RepID=UPI0021C409AF|nr:polysaccharide pyruvyl transferase family protein [Vibrio cortegadensis]MDN3697721.1 polysaccharide pyruvyl transferase family protein [Vibrio cortegadensis]
MNTFNDCRLLLTGRPRIKNNRVNVYYWSPKWFKENIGDYLNVLISNELLRKRGISPNKPIKETKMLYGIGSILHTVDNNSTVWGSGVNGMCDTESIRDKTLDIRLVRGKLTRNYLLERGHVCPENFGDPGLLVSQLFPEFSTVTKKHDAVVIPNLFDYDLLKSDCNLPIVLPTVYRWKKFFEELNQAKFVIASSLHGIIMAESYGIPAVYLKLNKSEEIDFKFRDYYSGTGREKMRVAHNIEEALDMGGSEIPEIPSGIESSFPYELWR